MLKLQIFETEHYVRDDTGKVYIVVHWTMLVTPYILVWHTSLVDVLKIFHDADISVFVDEIIKLSDLKSCRPFPHLPLTACCGIPTITLP